MHLQKDPCQHAHGVKPFASLKLPEAQKKTQPRDSDGCTTNRVYVFSVAVYQKYQTRLVEVGRIDNFPALARKLSFLPTELDICDTRQH